MLPARSGNGRGRGFPQSLMTARSHTAATTGDCSGWNSVLSMLTIPSHLFVKAWVVSLWWRGAQQGEKDRLGWRGHTWGHHGQGTQGP